MACFFIDFNHSITLLDANNEAKNIKSGLCGYGMILIQGLNIKNPVMCNHLQIS